MRYAADDPTVISHKHVNALSAACWFCLVANTTIPSPCYTVGLGGGENKHRQTKLERVGLGGGGGLRQHNGRQERAGEAEVRSRGGAAGFGEGGAAGSGRCVKVIKTFHDIRVCEVPRADH